ncbi:VanW family protein [Chakrabartyella piscis]|uniref:VanW family protein n=1 Tax=Chakrabartyella piscis TaxID=2918914 RepID=UPI002958828B|nr:VanW family protein [Chakrabartyella piscis]
MDEQNNQVELETKVEVNTEVKPAKKKKGKIIGIVVTILVLALAGVAAGGYYAYQKDQEEQIIEMLAQEGVYPGVTVAGLDVTGMSADAIALLLEGDASVNRENWTVQLTWQDEKWSYSLEELGVSALTREAAEAAYTYGRSGDQAENVATIHGLATQGVNFAVAYDIDTQNLVDILADLQEDIDQEMVEATMTREDGAFVVTEDQTGRTLDVLATKNAILSMMETMLAEDASGVNSGSVELLVTVEEPTYTEELFLESQDLIGTFYTTYTFSDLNRNTNLEVGCAYINGTIIMPDEEFSANEGLGEQTAERGYKDAGVYENGKVVSGMGGGVCQITTTLYNAAIFAEIEIVQRYAHSMPVGYVPLGRDAAVAGTYKDVVIKNDTEYPIYLEAFAVDGELRVNLYGYEIHEEGRTLEYKTVWDKTVEKPAEIITEDPEMYEDERVVTYSGQTGSVISVYKLVYQDGELISEDFFNKSTYISVADEVTVGTKVREETTPTYVPSYEDLWGTWSDTTEEDTEEYVEDVVEEEITEEEVW